MLLAIGGLFAIFSFAWRFEDERMVYGTVQLAGDPNPSGVVQKVNWTAVSAVAVVAVLAVLAAPRLRRRRQRD